MILERLLSFFRISRPINVRHVAARQNANPTFKENNVSSTLPDTWQRAQNANPAFKENTSL